MPNTTLWYDMDEVKAFHPHVEECLINAIDQLGLQEKIEIVHHPDIAETSTIPDFALKSKSDGRYLFILEVKRSKASVESERFWIQTNGYVTALGNRWITPGPKYFAITNLEETIIFAERNEHVTRCLLKGGRFLDGNFIKDNPTSLQEIKDKFTENLKVIISKASLRQPPEFINNWLGLVDSFYATYESVIRDNTSSDPRKTREISLYELLSFLFYYYLKDSYTLNRHQNSSAFRAMDHRSTDLPAFINSVANNYHRVLGIDFRQIFTDYPGNEKIIPNNLTENVFNDFKEFINKLEDLTEPALLEDPSPKLLFNLLTNKIYERDELHKEGKIMSDPELAKLLAELVIERLDSQVIDPGNGDGSLLDAAYDKINLLYLASGNSVSHNTILAQLHGYEIDPFLNQLATFKLVSKNLNDVNNHTEVDLVNGDVFSNPRAAEFDAVVMNPPFLRNDDPDNFLSEARVQTMLSAIKTVENGVSFVEQATQPNLYFYFVNWIMHYLKDKGKAGIILMAKFMNNEDGTFLKNYIKDSVESIIVYPSDYFEEFRVTTCIIVLRKNSDQRLVNFLKITNRSLLDEPELIREILEQPNTNINSDYTLKKVSRDSMEPEANWRVHLLDPKGNFEKIYNFELLKKLGNGLFSESKRGVAGNTGGSTTIFLNDSDTLSALFPNIEAKYIGNGFKNNRVHRNYSMTLEDLSAEKGVLFPAPYENCIDGSIKLEEGFRSYFEAAENKYGKAKWKKIVNETYRSKAKAQIIIPRAEREKHAIYFSKDAREAVVSTNFFCYSGLEVEGVEIEISLKMISAYLLSAFGQIQFEMFGNNQEGLLKIEKFAIDKLKSIDPAMLGEEDMIMIGIAFDEFSTLGVTVKGDEGVRSPRKILDLAIAKVLLKYSTTNSSTPEELADFAELFLEELVIDRSS